MLKMFKYELLILALAFCALQYGRVQNNDYTSHSFLQSDRGEEETGSHEWSDGSDIKSSVDETNITAMEQFLGVSARSSTSNDKGLAPADVLREYHVEV
jgi:hypothetical protein